MAKHDELVLECAKCGYTSNEWFHFNEDEEEYLKTITDNIIQSISILIDKKLDLLSSTVNNN